MPRRRRNKQPARDSFSKRVLNNKGYRTHSLHTFKPSIIESRASRLRFLIGEFLAGAYFNANVGEEFDKLLPHFTSTQLLFIIYHETPFEWSKKPPWTDPYTKERIVERLKWIDVRKRYRE